MNLTKDERITLWLKPSTRGYQAVQTLYRFSMKYGWSAAHSWVLRHGREFDLQRGRYYLEKYARHNHLPPDALTNYIGENISPS